MKTIFPFLLFLLNSVSSVAAPVQISQDTILISNNIESWADTIIRKRMEDFHIPGLAFVFVKGDSVLFAKGYGYANLEKSMPVDPYKTNFDMGSVPKALTAVAALQLVQSGRLNLYEPVNKWIPYFSKKEGYKNPITLHHLLTHSAGLDDMSNIASAARSANDVIPLAEFIETTPPIRFAAPGEIISYSNLGYGLIGLMIESASKIKFPEYMEQNMLQPLDMAYSSFFPKLNGEMEDNRALGYEFIAGEYHAVPINYQLNTPAAGLRSTAGDMANFIRMQLNNGSFKGRQLVDHELIRKMQERQFSNHSGIQGLGYSLREEFRNGWRVLGQNGGWQGFNHDLYLIKDQGIGMMVSMNSDDGSEIGNALIASFIETFLPNNAMKVSPPQRISNSWEYEGVFRSNRYSRHTITKFGALLGFVPEFEITSTRDSLYYYGIPLLFEGNDVFRRADGAGKIAFIRNSSGKVALMARDYSHYDANDKLGWFETSGFQMKLYYTIALFEIAIILLTIIRVARVRRRNKLRPPYIIFTLTQLVSALLPIIFVISLMAEFQAVGAWDFQYGATTTIKGILLIPFLLIGLLVYMGYLFFSGKAFSLSLSGKILYGTSIFTLMAFLAFLQEWNLIGFKF